MISNKSKTFAFNICLVIMWCLSGVAQDKIMLGVGLTAFVLSLVVLACKWYSDMKSPPMQPQPMFADNTKGPPSKQPQTGQNKKNKKNT